MAEVDLLRTEGAVYGGCCNRFADNMGCDCMSLAVDANKVKRPTVGPQGGTGTPPSRIIPPQGGSGTSPAMTAARGRHEVQTPEEIRSMIISEIHNDRKTAQKKEMVDHPEHYGGDTPYEVIKVLRAWLTREEFIGWLKGTIIKYQARAGKKFNTTEDFEKCSWYSRYLAEFIKETEK